MPLGVSFCYCCCFVFQGKFLCVSDCHGTVSEDHTGHEFRDSPDSALRVLGLNVCEHTLLHADHNCCPNTS